MPNDCNSSNRSDRPASILVAPRDLLNTFTETRDDCDDSVHVNPRPVVQRIATEMHV